MRSAPLFLALAALLGTPPILAAKTVPGIEASAFVAPEMGPDFDDHFGVGISFAASAKYEFDNSAYNEFFIGQFEGIYMHSEGTNSIGGPSHKEKLDAGFGFLNLGAGADFGDFSFTILVGAGFGGGSLEGDTALDDLALDTAFQVKPRLSWNFARNWAAYVEYRYLRTASVFGDIFTDKDDRALSMHAFGLGVAYSF